MAGTSGRRKRNRCSFCDDRCEPSHCLILVRQASGVWRTLYNLCWECGWRELQWARRQHGMSPLPFVYQWVEAQA